MKIGCNCSRCWFGYKHAASFTQNNDARITMTIIRVQNCGEIRGISYQFLHSGLSRNGTAPETWWTGIFNTSNDFFFNSLFCIATKEKWWLIIDWTIGNVFRWNLNQSVIQEITFEYVICKIASILFRLNVFNPSLYRSFPCLYRSFPQHQQLFVNHLQYIVSYWGYSAVRLEWHGSLRQREHRCRTPRTSGSVVPVRQHE